MWQSSPRPVAPPLGPLDEALCESCHDRALGLALTVDCDACFCLYVGASQGVAPSFFSKSLLPLSVCVCVSVLFIYLFIFKP